jgi:site-specific DNA-methyltransferase (adenine-specific)
MTRAIAATLASARVKNSTARDDWQTPPKVLERVRMVGPIVLDPCTSEDNPVGASFALTERQDGLAVDWADVLDDDIYSGLVFANFPYSRAKLWAAKIVEESTCGLEIVTLCAARPDSRWFFNLVWDSAQAVCFYRGRLRFVGAPSSAPFPSALVYHGPCPWAFEAAFADAGKVIRL